MRIWIPLVAAGVALGGTLPAQAPTPEAKDYNRAPVVKDFLSSGKRLIAKAAPKAPDDIEALATVQTYDWIAYSRWWCDVAWNGKCEGTEVFDASAQGWQACKFLYSQASAGGWDNRLTVGPDNWYANDPESPDRFRAYRATLYAYGSHNIFNQVGAWIDLRNVGMRLIPAWANNYQRYAAGCDMPYHD